MVLPSPDTWKEATLDGFHGRVFWVFFIHCLLIVPCWYLVGVDIACYSLLLLFYVSVQMSCLKQPSKVMFVREACEDTGGEGGDLCLEQED